MSNEHRGWIGVDLDGTLAHYDGWRGMDHIGEPIAPMIDRVKQFLLEGREVRIFTARVCAGQDPAEVDKFLQAFTKWMIKHIGQALRVTCEKDWAMILLYDDRCVPVEQNTGKLLQISTVDKEQMRKYLRVCKEFGKVDSEYTRGLVNGIELALAYLEEREAVFEPAKAFQSVGVELISAERIRQVEKEGYSPEDDLKHNSTERLSAAAASYALAAFGNYEDAAHNWPWRREGFKPSSSFRDLVKAGALIAAAIDRIKAEEVQKGEENGNPE